MGRVRASVDVGALASTAEELWYDTSRWPAFVNGLAHVEKVEGDWPRAGRVVWDSPHGGRGRVVEVVQSYEARVGQTVRIEDDKIRGTQRVAFEPSERGCRVTVTVEFALKTPPPVPVVVELFTRRPMRDGLKRTLARFRRELETPPERVVA